MAGNAAGLPSQLQSEPVTKHHEDSITDLLKFHREADLNLLIGLIDREVGSITVDEYHSLYAILSHLYEDKEKYPEAFQIARELLQESRRMKCSMKTVENMQKFSESSDGLMPIQLLVITLILVVIIGGLIGGAIKWSGIELEKQLEKQVNLVSGEIENIERLMELRMRGIVKFEEGKVVEVGGKKTKTKINKKAKATKVKPKKKLENRPKEKKKIKKKVRTGEAVYRTVMNP
jgi:hypothetical protein